MKNLFAYDGLLATGARYVWKMFILNLCFVLTSLPIFTIGASASALYAMFLEGKKSGGNIKNYFQQFAANFRKATALWLLALPVGALLVFNFFALNTWTIPLAGVLRIVMLAVGAVYLLALAFLFPLQAKFENTVGRTLKNALMLGISMPLRGAVIVLVTGLPAIALGVDTMLFARVMSVWLLFGFSASAQIGSKVADSVFVRLQPAKPEETE